MSLGSDGGVDIFAGVATLEDSVEDTAPGMDRFCFVSSAASPMDTADAFLCVVLNANLGLGSYFALVS